MCVTPIPSHDMDVLRHDALEACEQVRVDADLEERPALDGSSQLRVGDLVAPRPEARSSVDPKQEVREADPAAVEERAW